MDLYASKAAIVGHLEPIVDRLASAGVSADVVTLAALPLAVLAAASLLASPAAPALLIFVPGLAGLRLVLNLLDGSLARKTGRIHPRGELLNEVVDRVADVCFLAPVAALPGAVAAVVLMGVIVALLGSYVGVTTKAAGGGRIYRGVLSKPGRMVLLTVSALGYLIVGNSAWAVFGPILLIGAVLTLIERLVVAMRTLP